MEARLPKKESPAVCVVDVSSFGAVCGMQRLVFPLRGEVLANRPRIFIITTSCFVLANRWPT